MLGYAREIGQTGQKQLKNTLNQGLFKCRMFYWAFYQICV